MRIFLIALSLFVLSSIAQADNRKIELVFYVPVTLSEEQEKKMEILKILISELSVDIVEPVDIYGQKEITVSKTHICKHDTGGLCDKETVQEIKNAVFMKEGEKEKVESDIKAIISEKAIVAPE